MGLSAQGRFFGAVAAVVLLMAATGIFIFSCAPNGVLASVTAGLGGAIVSLLTGGATDAVSGGLSGISFSICLGWIPAVIGLPISIILAVLAVVSGIQVILG